MDFRLRSLLALGGLLIASSQLLGGASLAARHGGQRRASMSALRPGQRPEIDWRGAFVDDPSEFSSNEPFPRDAITPIYNPEFLPADQAPLSPEELVLGISIRGNTKAYPVSVLRFRELVNDELAGTPFLVSW